MIEKIKISEKTKKSIYLMLIGALVSIVSIYVGAYAGYGALHYLQGINLMSSPGLLMSSYIMGCAFSVIVLLMGFSKWE